MIKLYHYSHCPFCVRVRIALGLLHIPFETVLVAYDDEATPMNLIGKKMLPIVVDDQGQAMGESLDIIGLWDKQNILNTSSIRNDKDFPLFEDFLNKMGKMVHSLCMPHWIYTKEFNEQSRQYFQKKKESQRGPFSILIKNRSQFESELKPYLTQIEYKLNPFYNGNSISLYDVMIASHLWGLYCVPEFQFSSKMHDYLQTIKKYSSFEYQSDLWK
jgi:glutaredoxin 2